MWQIIWKTGEIAISEKLHRYVKAYLNCYFNHKVIFTG